MICQQCDKANDSDAVFCVQCSQPLLKSCPSCSTQNPGDARFCKKCRAGGFLWYPRMLSWIASPQQQYLSFRLKE